MKTKANHRIQVTPGYALLFVLAQLLGAPDPGCYAWQT